MRRIILFLALLPSFAYAQAVKQNEAQASIYPTALQSGPHSAVDRYGNNMCSLQAGTAATTNPIKLEDSASSSGDAGFLGLFKRLDQLATGEVGGNSRYGFGLLDTISRLYVNPWGSAVTEFIQGCNSAITTATTGAMLAGEASQRYYISSWQCTNTGGAATRVILEDGAGTDLANVMLAATTGFASVNFPVPARASALNSAAQINVITTGTSTVCCFNGFKSPY